MSYILLRRRKLGSGSCHGIRRNSEEEVLVCRNDVRNRKARRNLPNHTGGYPNRFDTIIRWGCTDRIPDRFNTIQPAAGIQTVNNKTTFRRTLQEADPELVPRTWFDPTDNNITFPCVARPRQHAQGRQFFVCSNRHDLNMAFTRCGQGMYVSELINKMAEYRVFVVQGRVACVARKTPGNPEAVAWNVAQGGRFDHVRWDDWPLQAVRKSVEAFNLSGLDFGGVDVMVDADNRAYIIEINSAPSLPLKQDGTPTHRQLCMAKCFDWMMRHGKERIGLTQERGGYLKFIHPAICDRAILAGV